MSAAPGNVSAVACVAGRTVAEPRLAPDGGTVAFLSMGPGATQLVLVDAAGGIERVLPTEVAPSRTHPMAGGVLAWAPDSGSLAFCGADGSVWRQPVDGAAPQVVWSPADTADGAEGPSLSAPCFSPDGDHLALVADERALMVIPLGEAGSTGSAWMVPNPHEFAFDPVWLDETTLLWQAWSAPDMPWDHSALMMAVVGGSSTNAPSSGSVRALVDRPDTQVSQPQVRNGRLAYLSDATGWLNLWIEDRVAVDEAFEHGGPTWGMGIRSFAWSPDGARVAFCRNEGGFGRLCVLEVATGAVQEVARAVHAGLSWEGNRLVALRTGGVTPTAIVSYDVTTWARTLLARGPAVGIERGAVEPDLVTFPGADGYELHGRLYRTPVPFRGLLCWIHGGPTDQWPVTFNARIAYFVSRGWTVLVPDHRGSTGHGRAFAQALRGQWGLLDVADVAAALTVAHERGWSAPSTTAVIGGSAGGFTALGVAATAPDRLCAVVALYPVT
ncbi:MAG: hypothetical protein JWL70_1145, partial [Acidimicrobiia bacterium]|nr:hypothetical protein [Acidimicrobiia bacterium]